VVYRIKAIGLYSVYTPSTNHTEIGQRPEAAVPWMLDSQGRHRSFIRKGVLMNLFTYKDLDQKFLVFATLGGHLSGTLMKNIDYRLPKEIQKFKDWLDEGRSIGDVFISKYVVFFVFRKHYNSKVKEDQFEALLKQNTDQLKSLKIATTNEDLPQYKELIQKHIPNIEYRDTSKWE
jgi:hypothetical protein